MKNFFQRMRDKKSGKNQEKGKFVATTRSILAEGTGNGDLIRRPRQGTHRVGNPTTIDSLIQFTQSDGGSYTNSTKSVPVADTRKAVEPKEVFEMIKKETPEISFDNLDAKIEVVEERLRILKEHLDEGHLGDENQALFYLRNRRKYLTTRTKFPMDWALTTQDAIDDLCKNYKLKVVPLKQYYTLVPKDGIKEMDKYSKAYEAITGDKPIFELVIKDNQEAPQKKKDRDPILLANSALGNHLCVLGAWDDEVEIVDEIIYEGQ